MNYYIREVLPLGDMGDNVILRFESADLRDQVLNVWWESFANQKTTGKPIAEQSKKVYGQLVNDRNLRYWLNRLS